MGVITTAVKGTEASCAHSVKSHAKNMLEELGYNTKTNMDLGSKGCPVLNEGRNLVESIAMGDMLKSASNGGLLAVYAIASQRIPSNVNIKVPGNSIGQGFTSAGHVVGAACFNSVNNSN